MPTFPPPPSYVAANPPTPKAKARGIPLLAVVLVVAGLGVLTVSTPVGIMLMLAALSVPPREPKPVCTACSSDEK